MRTRVDACTLTRRRVIDYVRKTTCSCS